MTENEYNQRADDVLTRIETVLDNSETDIDCDMAPGGVLEMTFPDGSLIVINKQRPLQEIWVAAKSGGFHYRYRDGEWRNTRDDSELFQTLSRLVGEKAGAPVAFG